MHVPLAGMAALRVCAASGDGLVAPLLMRPVVWLRVQALKLGWLDGHDLGDQDLLKIWILFSGGLHTLCVDHNDLMLQPHMDGEV